MLADFIDLSNMDVTIKDMVPCLKIFPELINKFNLDIKGLSRVDIIELLHTGNMYFLEIIEVEPNDFSITEAFNLCKIFDFCELSLQKFELIMREMSSQCKREIIIKTKERYLNYFNIDALEPLDWLAILRDDKKMVRYCRVDLFLNGDIFYLVELVVLFPEFQKLINESNCDKITSLGWEKLLIAFPLEYLNICDFSKINAGSWRNILRERPELSYNINNNSNRLL